MTNIYLVRHGQAGTRDSYDSLSRLGRKQARLLGEYFVSERVEFSAAHVGTMRRQRETAEEVASAYADARLPFPEPSADPGWDEFDFQHVYEELAPLLCAEDEEFRGEYEEVRAQIAASAGAHDAEVHRRWRKSDTKVVEAWTSGRYPYAGESWEEFLRRVSGCRVASDGTGDTNVVVFTSATPTAVWTGRALDIADGRLRRLAAVLQNSSFTLLGLRGEDLLLFTFNAVPHLSSAELRTRR
ncbi:MAG TPA: histidine phosphatase family protein [Pyrinomonadaceae bacterium]|nr:histidine phosphatase family protein [Pyrinomonadaceae bacterium]